MNTLTQVRDDGAVQEPTRRALGSFNGIWAKVKTWFQGGV